MSGFGKLRRYLTLPTRTPARIKREVDEELQAHIAMRAEELERTGLSPREARAVAMRKFGDLDDATRYCTEVDRDSERRRRASGWLAEAHQDVRHTFRVLRRNPAFAVATVLTLALAIGASTTVYGVLHTYLVRDLPFPHSDRLVSLFNPPAAGPDRREPSLRDVDWTTVDSLFEATATWDIDGFTLADAPYAENVTGAWVSSGYFRALSVRPAIGRGFREDEYRDPAPVVLISHDLWVRRFRADSAIIGTTVTMHSVDHPTLASIVTIVGVTPRDFWPIHWRESDVLRPMPPNAHEQRLLALLKPGMTRHETQRRLDAVVRPQVTEEVDPTWHMPLVPALVPHSSRVRGILGAVFGAALFMLLAACGSVAGALVSRMAARERELAIRRAIGGSRARIVRQVLTESAVLATLAGLLGLAIAYVLLATSAPLIERLLGVKVPGGAAALRPDASILMLSLAASVIAGIALGLVPALTFLRLDRRSTASAVLGAGRGAAARAVGTGVRRTLIAGQVMAAMVLLFGAGLMFRTIARMHAIELGFRVDGVVTGSMLLPDARYPDSTSRRRLVDRMLARVAETRGVRNAAVVYPRPFQGALRLPVTTEGVRVDPESAPRASVYTVSQDYFATMDVRLRAGRLFRATDDHAAPLVVVISERLARRIAPSGDAIGRRINVRVPLLANWNDHDAMPWRTVVGIVSDTEKEFAPNAPPDVYVPYAQNPRNAMSMVVHTGRDEAAIVEPMRRAVASIDPTIALSGVRSMRDIIADQGGQRRGLTLLLGAFGAFALGLSALALYASLSYMVVQRRSELAVRMAVGANTRSILRLVVAEGAITAAIGITAGVVASLALGRVLANQVYGVGTRDPVTLVGISSVLVLAAVAACVVPGLRAAHTDPAAVLRE